jgi:hypothetical protein
MPQPYYSQASARERQLLYSVGGFRLSWRAPLWNHDRAGKLIRIYLVFSIHRPIDPTGSLARPNADRDSVLMGGKVTLESKHGRGRPSTEGTNKLRWGKVFDCRLDPSYTIRGLKVGYLTPVRSGSIASPGRMGRFRQSELTNDLVLFGYESSGGDSHLKQKPHTRESSV